MNPSKIPSKSHPLTDDDRAEVLQYLKELSPEQVEWVMQILRAIIAKDYPKLEKMMEILPASSQGILQQILQDAAEAQA